MSDRRLNDLQAFFNAMRPVRVQHQGPYTPDDRFRDFQQVFFGSEQGRRVLAQIIDECEGLPPTMSEVSDHAFLAFKAGKREVGMRIVQWMQGVAPEVEIEEASEDE